MKKNIIKKWNAFVSFLLKKMWIKRFFANKELAELLIKQ